MSEIPDYAKMGYPTDRAEIERIYKDTQTQRRLEREIRGIKREIIALEAKGDEIGAESVRLKGKESQLTRFLQDTGETRQRQRVLVAGFDDGTLKKKAAEAYNEEIKNRNIPSEISQKDLKNNAKYDIINTGGENIILHSEKSIEIINNQPPVDSVMFERVKKALAEKGVVIEQSEDIDRYLMSRGIEAITYYSGQNSEFGDNITMHSKVSASGFFEELIHYGQMKSGRAIEGNNENRILLEIEAQKRLIKNQKAYKITDYEIEVLKNNLKGYETELEKIRKEGV